MAEHHQETRVNRPRRSELLPTDRHRELVLAAEELWSESGRRIPVRLHEICEHLIIGRSEEPLPEDVEGLMYTKPPYTIVLNSTKGRHRRRFTEAHELGHFRLGHDLGEALYRETGDAVFGVDPVADPALARLEVEASAFGAALLMPETQIRADLNNLHEYGDDFWAVISEKYDVSIPAARHRLFQLADSDCFQGLAYGDTGAIICAYPASALERSAPGIADAVWLLNSRSGRRRRRELPSEVVARFHRATRNGHPGRHLAFDFDLSGWLPVSSPPSRGTLHLRSMSSANELYFRFELDPGALRGLE